MTAQNDRGDVEAVLRQAGAEVEAILPRRGARTNRSTRPNLSPAAFPSNGSQRSGASSAASRLLDSSVGSASLASRSLESLSVDDAQVDLHSGMRLCCAAASGSRELVQQLLANGVSVNAEDYCGRVALHIVAAYGHEAVAQDLLSSQADVDRKDHFGNSPLSDAVRHNQEHVAALLLRARHVGSLRGGSRGKGTPQVEPKGSEVGGSEMGWMVSPDEVRFGSILHTTLKSVVYDAEWRGVKVVAKKVIRHSQCESDEPVAKETLREICLLSSFRHPDLVMFLGACLFTPQPFFIMEFMDGGDLDFHFAQKASSRHNRPYRVGMDVLLKWSSAVARALNYRRPAVRKSSTGT
ncbi:unnamed protein product [Prorocentrum cordatum]|uniref:Protein kinase domain-containing protein n=1 Tax=Prorocentrum cordatum TaxID=2364126 RepID=A0ABN9YA83_9DINO|nr:unnamed protein product [Polarella glacialis]